MHWYGRERALPVLVCKADGGRRALLGGAGWDQTPRDVSVSPAVPDSCTASGQGPCPGGDVGILDSGLSGTPCKQDIVGT